jgi:hypothetical protein
MVVPAQQQDLPMTLNLTNLVSLVAMFVRGINRSKLVLLFIINYFTKAKIHKFYLFKFNF